MDPSTIIPAASALLGTVIGGLVTFLTTFYLKKAEWKQEQITREITKREALYGEFLSEVGRLLMAGIGSKVQNPNEFRGLFTLLGRIRMCASEPVRESAENLVKVVLHGNRERGEETSEGNNDGFTKLCRDELESLRKKS